MSPSADLDAARYGRERAFFDTHSAATEIRPMGRAVLERYAHPRRPHLFMKEWMFHLVKSARDKTVLELGCGEGVSSVQLAYAGCKVVGVDLSPQSIEVARARAAINGVEVEFRVGNIETDEIGYEQYGIVWCGNILHHVVPSLEAVIRKAYDALKPGGLFVACEPVAYTAWLQAIRRLMPASNYATADEQPLRASELQVVRKQFPNTTYRYFRILARIDRMTRNLWLIALAAAIDNLILRLRGAQQLAGHVVVSATKGT